jgi:hypothetical protein
MISRTELSDFLPSGMLGAGATDDAVVQGFGVLLVSHNAESAFCGYLGVACEIGVQRPHLFERLLAVIIDPAYCMGVESADSFVEYAKILIEQDASREHKYQNFSRDGIRYFRQFINGHLSEIQRVLDCRVQEGALAAVAAKACPLRWRSTPAAAWKNERLQKSLVLGLSQISTRA